jgi:hypothetical protein
VQDSFSLLFVLRTVIRVIVESAKRAPESANGADSLISVPECLMNWIFPKLMESKLLNRIVHVARTGFRLGKLRKRRKPRNTLAKIV